MNFLATDWAAKWARYSPDKIALKEYDTQRTLSYAELNRKGSSLAAYFQQQGLKKGDRIGVIAEYSLEFILVFVAAQKSGMIIVPLNYRLTSAELDYMLKDAEPAMLIYQDDFGALIQACPSFASIPRTLKMVDLGEYSAKESISFSSCHLQADDPIFILYTSGTTGFPKGSIYTHGMLFWNSINTAMSLLINTESRTVNFMPPFHTGGWNVLLTPLWHHGGYVCLLKAFDADQVLEALEEEQATLCMAVPTMLGMLKDGKGFAEANLSRLHYMIVGGEAMPIPLIEVWQEKGIAIRQGFGMTEVGPNLFSLHQRDAIR
ncbi:AMP-binding protein, partial [Okeania hirsuta]